MDFWRIVVSILLPPLGVFWHVGLTKHFWINVLLTILGYIPGLVHAVWGIAKYKCGRLRILLKALAFYLQRRRF